MAHIGKRYQISTIQSRAFPAVLNIRRGVASIAPVTQKFPDHPLPSEQALDQRESRRASIRNAKPFSSFLTDTFQRQHDYLRISITEKCNLRCLYCMPEEGVPQSPPPDLLTTPEIFLLSSTFVSQGVTKIRLTGGEPTVRRDILPLMHQIGSLRSKGLRELCLTSNGISLRKKLDSMVEAGLTGVNLSLDTLDPWQFQVMTRRKGFEAVMKSIERILEMNKFGAGIKLKINCVVMRGINDREILPFVELSREQNLEVRFIEYMPFDGNKWNKGKMLPYQEMLDIIRSKYPDLQKVQDHKNDTSKTYKIPGFVGRMGFITSMTHNFCGTCNRLRITSDGNLKVCLFGNAEVSLRDILRKSNQGNPIDEQAFEALKFMEHECRRGLVPPSDPIGGMTHEKELLDVIGLAVKGKKEKHAGIGELENMKNRPMILIEAPLNPKLSRQLTSPQAPWNRIPSHLLYPSRSISSVRFYSTKSSNGLKWTAVETAAAIPFEMPENAAEHFKVRRVYMNTSLGSLWQSGRLVKKYQPASPNAEGRSVKNDHALTSEAISSSINNWPIDTSRDPPSNHRYIESSAQANGEVVQTEVRGEHVMASPSHENSSHNGDGVYLEKLRLLKQVRLKYMRFLKVEESRPRESISTEQAVAIEAEKEFLAARVRKAFFAARLAQQDASNSSAGCSIALVPTDQSDTEVSFTICPIRYINFEDGNNVSTIRRLRLRKRRAKGTLAQEVERGRPESEDPLAEELIQGARTARGTDIQRGMVFMHEEKAAKPRLQAGSRARAFSTSSLFARPKLTHLTTSGAVHMVDIAEKDVTSRTAVAVCSIYFSNSEVIPLIKVNQMKKGDVLGVARIAGIMAAKKTSELIPLCHPVGITSATVDLKVQEPKLVDAQKPSAQSLPEAGTDQEDSCKFHTPSGHVFPKKDQGHSYGSIDITASVSCDGKTGVEMEALTACSTAALAVYDMCKAVDKRMRIENLHVVEKSGGRSGHFLESPEEREPDL